MSTSMTPSRAAQEKPTSPRAGEAEAWTDGYLVAADRFRAGEAEGGVRPDVRLALETCVALMEADEYDADTEWAAAIGYAHEALAALASPEPDEEARP